MSELTSHQIEQMRRYGEPFRSTEEERDRAVLDCSVYNVLSRGRQDRTVSEVQAALAVAWAPPERRQPLPDCAAILEAGRRLAAAGLIRLDDDMLRIPVRDPNGYGSPVAVDYMSGTVRRV